MTSPNSPSVRQPIGALRKRSTGRMTRCATPSSAPTASHGLRSANAVPAGQLAHERAAGRHRQHAGEKYEKGTLATLHTTSCQSDFPRAAANMHVCARRRQQNSARAACAARNAARLKRFHVMRRTARRPYGAVSAARASVPPAALRARLLAPFRLAPTAAAHWLAGFAAHARARFCFACRLVGSRLRAAFWVASLKSGAATGAGAAASAIRRACAANAPFFGGFRRAQRVLGLLDCPAAMPRALSACAAAMPRIGWRIRRACPARASASPAGLGAAARAFGACPPTAAVPFQLRVLSCCLPVSARLRALWLASILQPLRGSWFRRCGRSPPRSPRVSRFAVHRFRFVRVRGLFGAAALLPAGDLGGKGPPRAGVGGRGDEAQALAAGGMIERQRRRPQRDLFAGTSAAIAGVAPQRIARVRVLDADLVGATGEQRRLDQRAPAALAQRLRVQLRQLCAPARPAAPCAPCRSCRP